MAQTIDEIENDIVATIQADPVLAAQLNSTSKVAIWRLLARVAATVAFTLQKQYDLLVVLVNEIIASLKPHSLRWYALKAKAFQYGYNLVAESDYYDNTGIADSVVLASKIVAYAAVVEQTRGLRIKVATDNGTDLGPLSTPKLTAFVAYMQRLKDAGVKLLITTAVADSLKLTIDIYFNPLVISATGGRVDGTVSDPVGDAIRNYLKNLPFNGVFLLQNLVDVLQKVEGVTVVDVKAASAQYGALPFVPFPVEYIPDAGYLRLFSAGDLILTFIPYSE